MTTSVKTLSISDLTVRDFVDACLGVQGYTTTGKDAWLIVCLFGGDRRSCCDTAIMAFDESTPVGLATLSARGESGDGPALVGLYVLPQYRRQGIGRQLLRAAAEYAQQQGWSSLRVDCVTRSGLAVAEAVAIEFPGLFDVRGFGALLL